MWGLLVKEKKIEPLSFSELFGNNNPVEIEIGAGKSRFLIERAAKNPNINFLSIERVGKWLFKGKEKAGKRGVANIKFLKAEAKTILEEAIPSKSVSVFHVYFPDPWPKKRHKRRRFVNPYFLKLIAEKLMDNGILELVTDDENYYKYMRESISETKELWRNIRESINQRFLGDEMKTDYELKFEAQNKKIHYMEISKK